LYNRRSVLNLFRRLVFGYGHLTWEWSEGLRSYLHPLLFAALFKIIALLRVDTPSIVALSPRLLQARVQPS
jgi:phosphatidylinositol glycan class B